MKLTTDTIKPFLESKYNTPANKIKRISKFKNESGQVVREFAVADKTVHVVSSPDDQEVVEIIDGTSGNSNVTKTKGLNPQDWYFYVYRNLKEQPGEPPSFLFVKKKYWQKNKYLQDEEYPRLDAFLVNYSFFSLMELCYEYADINTLKQLDMNTGRQILTQLGFEENPDLNRGPSFSDVYPPVFTPWGQ